ncbi:MAG: hypothetical protein ABI742_07635 [Gemmatimonadota bacterium]
MTTLFALFIGALAGLHTSSWGMFKDAAHEGFTLRTFLRSILLSTALAPIMVGLLGLRPADPASVVLLFGAVYATERALTETWKRFCFPSSPRGKFAGKPVLFPDFLRLRLLAVPGYVAIWMLVLAAFTTALYRIVI